MYCLSNSDTDPDPPDPHIFGCPDPGSGKANKINGKSHIFLIIICSLVGVKHFISILEEILRIFNWVRSGSESVFSNGGSRI